MNKLLSAATGLLLLTSLPGCLLKPTTKYDKFEERAQLPREESVHPRNSVEWWYFTGHLRDQQSGAQYGIEYVFFHFNPSGKRDYLMVNVAVTDPQRQQFHYDYALQAQARILPDSLPIRLRLPKQNQLWTLGGQEGRYQLQATMVTHPGTGFALTTRPTKPVLLHGGTGYEQYGPVAKAGYYSYPRLATTGTLTLDGQPRPVAGELWYDRQWNCGNVNKRHIAWDWLSIQLDETREDLMLYTVHNKKTQEHIGGGSLFGPQGENLHLAEQDFRLEPLDSWRSPSTGRQYPARWRVQVPSKGYDLTVEPLVPNQELSLKLFKGLPALNYWEGMCRVTGTHHGQPVKGNAYVEITNR
ncbi:lipocalin family protein [Hymenobacter sp. CRA2]|uniref:lipocalin family protein n=1 Tax=Hymenobacter sp. CRA2 TaxID=1955620 RepID=UPI0015926731|nr:lipocalin family protein [Hymenobacter sp. CRA2]